MKLPEKDYLTFDELAVRWKCTKHDLFHYVATKKLVPSIFVAGKFQQYFVEPFEDNQLSISAIGDNDELLREEYLNGIYYLNWMNAISRKVCNFSYFSNNRVLDEFDMPFGLDQSVSLTILDNDIVFIPDDVVITKEEINHFEVFHMCDVESKNSGNTRNEKLEVEKTLGNRERNNLLKIIAALCHEEGLTLDKRFKTALNIETRIKALGLTLSDQTIAPILEKASNLIKSNLKH